MTFIPRLHTDLRDARSSRRGATHEAKDVPTGLHKAYARMEQVRLPQPASVDMPFAEILEKRNSYIKGSDHGEIPLQTWGTLLGLALGRKRKASTKRNYPSGGGLYPIETYIITNAIPQCAPAAFHYNPTAHALEKLWDMPPHLDIGELIHVQERFLFSSCVVFTSVWARSSAKYGDYAYTLALLETGHMSENVLLTATALGLQSRPMTGFKDDVIVRLLELDLEHEQLVHSITLST